jgi:hypothetical protein
MLQKMKLPVTITRSLTDRQAIFVQAILAGSTPRAAAIEAGYPDRPVAYRQVMESPAVRAAIEAGIRAELVTEHAPAAFRFLARVLRDENFGERARVDAAKILVDRAGFLPRQTVAVAAEDKDPDQMTTEELHALVERLGHELAGRARDITPRSEPMGADVADLL